jgi:hypothetical protein
MTKKDKAIEKLAMTGLSQYGLEYSFKQAVCELYFGHYDEETRRYKKLRHQCSLCVDEYNRRGLELPEFWLLYVSEDDNITVDHNGKVTITFKPQDFGKISTVMRKIKKEIQSGIK